LVLGTVALEGYLKTQRRLGSGMRAAAPGDPTRETLPDLARQP
jgi:hypothetical protein